MSSPAEDIDLKPEKMEEKEGESFHCDLYDKDLVHKIAQEFLPGLSSACIDNTTGGLFSSPALVAVEIRREMVDYLIQRSENYVAESVVLETGPNEEISKDPYDIISDFIDDFATSKRNFFSRVSGWLLSERREDRIDDFVQEMDVNGFWLLNRRESIAQTLLKNVDFKNQYHCDMSFKTKDELDKHKSSCGFRTMLCTNEGCNARFSAAHMDNHDSTCPFKILQCEQGCPEYIMRRDMDRHCITVCPMKLVKCPFYSVGCQTSIPQTTVVQHRSENLSSHLLNVLQILHKEASVDDLKGRVEEILELSSPGQLAAAREARSLTHAIKPLEVKLGPVKVKPKTTDEAGGGKEESKGSPTKEVKLGEVSRESISSRTNGNEDHPNKGKEKLEEQPADIGKQPNLKEESQKSKEEEARDEHVEEEKTSDEHVVKSSPPAKEASEKSIEEEKASDEHVATSPPPAKDESEKSVEEEKASDERGDELEKSIEEEKTSGEHAVTLSSPPSAQPVEEKDDHAYAAAALDVFQTNNENSVADAVSLKESSPRKEQQKEATQSIEGATNVHMNSVAEVDGNKNNDNNEDAVVSQLQLN